MSSIAIPGIVAASRRRTAASTILGNNTTGSGSIASVDGSLFSSKFTLASTATLTELHIWIVAPLTTPFNTIIHIYRDSAGSPGSRVAYTSPIASGTSNANIELAQTGFSVALTAGSYWLGFGTSGYAGSGGIRLDSTGGTHARHDTATFNPPNDPWGSITSSGTRKYCVWAVVV